MDTKVKGIVIKLADYKEADKIASIFSYEMGILSAKFPGVRREKAKLKSVAQPFVFAEFNLVELAGKRTVTGANVLDSFAGLLSDYNKTMCAYLVLDILRSVLEVEKEERDIFLLTLSALKNIEQYDEKIALIDFILKFINFSGVGVDFVEGTRSVYLDKSSGNFSQTRDSYSAQIDLKVYNLLKKINDVFLLNKPDFSAPVTGTSLENADNNSKNANEHASFTEKENAIKSFTEYSEKTIKQILNLLHNILFAKFGVDIKSFSFI